MKTINGVSKEKATVQVGIFLKQFKGATLTRIANSKKEAKRLKEQGWVEKKSFATELEANQYAQKNSYGNDPVNVYYRERDDKFTVSVEEAGISEKKVGQYHKGRKTYDAAL